MSDKRLVTVELITQILAIGRTKNCNVSNRIDEIALGSDVHDAAAERAGNILVGPLLEI